MSYVDRMTQEKADLDAKLDTLNAFMYSDAFQSLVTDERSRLANQAWYMSNYSIVLGMRIDAAGDISDDEATALTVSDTPAADTTATDAPAADTTSTDSPTPDSPAADTTDDTTTDTGTTDAPADGTTTTDDTTPPADSTTGA
jgi:hypothetical protein